MIIGGVHGAEFEGIAAICNLFSLLENGVDLAGRQQNRLLALMQNIHLIFVPCANPDGRVRVPYEGLADMPYEEFRYYAQGIWKDGSLCGWPDCKREHPIRNVGHLGGYYNDNGINLMHDNFFEPMADETKLLLKLADQYAPDLVIDLHGAGDMGYGIYATGFDQKGANQAAELEKRLYRAFTEQGSRYILTGCGKEEPSVNLEGAFTFLCGALSVTWESYQGVVKDSESLVPTEHIYDDILQAHYLFFTEVLQLVKALYTA